MNTQGSLARSKRSYFTLAFIPLTYFLLAILMTWPVAANLTTKLAGAGPDVWSHQWTFDWIKDSLLNGQNPFYTTRIFYPQGVTLTTHNIAWLHILIWIPLQAIVGAIAAYNLLFLAILTSTGFATYLLARELELQPPVAFVSGLIYAFWPYLLSQHDHPNMLFVCWVPLTLLFLRRTIRQQRWRDALLTALCVALLGWARWQLLIMATFIIGSYTLYLLWQTNAQRKLKQQSKQLITLGAFSAALMLPIAAPVAIAQFTRDNPQDLFLEEQGNKQTDLLAYILPSPMHTLFGEQTVQAYNRFYVNLALTRQESLVFIGYRTPFLGYTVLLLALLAVFKQGRKAWFWLLMSLLYFSFALGPELRFNGQLYTLPMPYRLIEDISLVRLVRITDRFNVLLGLPLAILAGLGLQWLITQSKRRRITLPFTAIIATLILFEYMPTPFPQSDPITPTWLTQLADISDDFAILHLPNHLYEHNKSYMFYQLAHDKAIVNGKVARVPSEAYTFWQSTPFLQQLTQNSQTLNFADVSHQLQTLATANVRYLVLHKDRVNDGLRLIWQDWLTIQPHYEDRDVIVYTTAPKYGEDFTFAHPLGPDLGLIKATLTNQTAVPGGTLKIDARWGSRAAPQHSHTLCLQLQTEDENIAHNACQAISSTWPLEKWQANEVVRAFYTLTIPQEIVAGDYQVVFALQDDQDHTVKTAVVGTVTILPVNITHFTDVTWQNGIHLLGYDWQEADDNVNVTLYWQTDQPINDSYKVFIHIFQNSTGELITQSDTVPRNWSYPTNLWEVNELIPDTITLTVPQLTEGSYTVHIGLYHEFTGDRLRLTKGNDQFPDIYQLRNAQSLTIDN